MPSHIQLTDDLTHQPHSSNHDLGKFHTKYNAGDSYPLQSTYPRYASPSYASPTQRRPPCSPRRVQELRAKRQRLRELQDWEYKLATTPRKWANAGPVGLIGFGMTTILLNLHNTGHFQLDTVVPAMGICCGGGAQFIAGLLEWVRGNTFAAVAFVSYGAFWMSLVCVWMLPNSSFKPWSTIIASSEYFLGVYLVVWGFFSFFMMLCTLRMNVAIFLVFFSVTLLFFWLGGANMAGNTKAVHAVGYEGVVCGALALYLAFAEVLNEVWDRVILPVFPMTQVLGWFRGNAAKDANNDSSKECNSLEKPRMKKDDDLV